MRGDLVIIKDIRNDPLVRRVWDVDDKNVYICTEERYQNLINDDDYYGWCIGFPRQLVFEYSPQINFPLFDVIPNEMWELLEQYNPE